MYVGIFEYTYTHRIPKGLVQFKLLRLLGHLVYMNGSVTSFVEETSRIENFLFQCGSSCSLRVLEVCKTLVVL